MAPASPARPARAAEVTTATELEAALASEDAPRARELLSQFHLGCLGVVAMMQEWIGYWHEELRSRGLSSVSERARSTLEATPGWQAELGDVGALYDDLTAALDAGPWDRALKAFTDYHRVLEKHHDQLCWELWALPSAVGDEGLALEISSATLDKTVGYQMLWQVAATLTPEQLAQMAAEHLRQHLSEVRVIDEPERIRVVLDTCGSGGRMRRGAPGSAPGYALVQEPSRHSWDRAGEVPLYCTHCSFNEQNSRKRLGRLAWVTEFDPDPSKPCGWTFFKTETTR